MIEFYQHKKKIMTKIKYNNNKYKKIKIKIKINRGFKLLVIVIQKHHIINNLHKN